MARTRRKIQRVTSDDARAALTSPVRLEILEHLGIIGPATVREIAGRMARTPHAIHYHVRRLAGAGLIERTGTRKSGPRDQAVYDITAEQYEMDVEPDGPLHEQPEVKTVRAALRRAERDFLAVAAQDPDRLAGEHGFVGRMRGRLSTGARHDVMKHVRAIQRIFGRELRRDHPPQARLETYALTMVLLPETRDGDPAGR